MTLEAKLLERWEHASSYSERERTTMNHKTTSLRTLASHPFPAQFAHSRQGRRIGHALSALEAQLVASDQGSILLLVEQELMQDIAMIAIERFLRYTQCQRVLLLVSPKLQTKMIEIWEHAVSWGDERTRTEQFSMTSMPQKAQEAQVCIATVFDIQVHIGV